MLAVAHETRGDVSTTYLAGERGEFHPARVSIELSRSTVITPLHLSNTAAIHSKHPHEVIGLTMMLYALASSNTCRGKLWKEIRLLPSMCLNEHQEPHLSGWADWDRWG